MKQTQINFVKDVLHRQGYITRNYCLSLPYKQRITRLGAIINHLINFDGYVFVNRGKKGNKWGEIIRKNKNDVGDYKYSLTEKYFNKIK